MERNFVLWNRQARGKGKYMFSKFLAPIAGATLLVATAFSAQAAPTVFDFTDSDPFTSNDGSVMNAYAYRFTTSIFGNSLSSRSVTQTSTGLGVSGLFSNQLSTFGLGFLGAAAEFIVLELPSDDWSPVSVSFGEFNPFIDDYLIFGSNGFDLSTTAGVAAAASSFDLLADSAGDTPPVANPFSDFTGSQYKNIIIAASILDPDLIPLFVGNSFTVASFTGVVPLPAALPLLATGLAVFGIVSLRRRRQVAA